MPSLSPKEQQVWEFIAEFLQPRRRVIAAMQPLFHDGEIVFQQIEQFGFDTLALLESGKNEPRYFDALSIATSAADDDGDVIRQTAGYCPSKIRKRLPGTIGKTSPPLKPM